MYYVFHLLLLLSVEATLADAKLLSARVPESSPPT